MRAIWTWIREAAFVFALAFVFAFTGSQSYCPDMLANAAGYPRGQHDEHENECPSCQGLFSTMGAPALYCPWCGSALAVKIEINPKEHAA